MVKEFYRPVPGFRPSTPAVTGKTYANELTEHSVVVIHFWAEWNGVDVPMDASIQDIKTNFKGRIHFVSCDSDSSDNHDLCKLCNVVNIPFLAIFVDGHPECGIMGLRPVDELADELEKRLSDSQRERRWWRFW